MCKGTSRPLHYLILSAMGSLLFFFQLGDASLWDVDEGRNATASLEMMERGEWIVPTFNSELRAHKPVLLYWLQIFAYYLFGISEFSARLPSALAALGTVLLCYELARHMFGARTGFWSGCIVVSTPMLCGAARFSNPDALLNCFVVLTMTLFWIGRSWRPSLWFAAMGAASGLAVLAKGPVGLVLPGGIIFLYLLWERQLHVLWDRRLSWGIFTFLAVAAPWYAWVTVETKGEFIRQFIFQHNVNRAMNAMENHGGIPGFYLIVLIVGTLPWSIFLGMTMWYAFWSLFKQAPSRGKEYWEAAQDHDDELGTSTTSAHRFLTIWILLFVGLFSAAATQLPNYVLPAVAPLAILTGRFLERWRRGAIDPASAFVHLSLGSLALMGAVIFVALLIVSGTFFGELMRGRLFPELAPWALVGLVPLCGAMVGWWLLKRGMRSQWLTLLVVGAVGFWAPLVAWANASFNRHKAPRPLVEIAHACQRDQQILVGGYQVDHLASLHFYVQRNIIHHKSEEEARAFLRYPLPVFLFMPAKTWESWQGKLSGSYRVLCRHDDLYRRDQVIVVTNR